MRERQVGATPVPGALSSQQEMVRKFAGVKQLRVLVPLAVETQFVRTGSYVSSEKTHPQQRNPLATPS
jgi:hypothetical protein